METIRNKLSFVTLAKKRKKRNLNEKVFRFSIFLFYFLQQQIKENKPKVTLHIFLLQLRVLDKKKQK